jgi:selenophosphate synthase
MQTMRRVFTVLRTSIVDDPYWFCAIATANSLSDVYAMGGKLLVALKIVTLPAGPDFADINKRTRTEVGRQYMKKRTITLYMNDPMGKW